MLIDQMSKTVLDERVRLNTCCGSCFAVFRDLDMLYVSV